VELSIPVLQRKKKGEDLLEKGRSQGYIIADQRGERSSIRGGRKGDTLCVHERKRTKPGSILAGKKEGRRRESSSPGGGKQKGGSEDHAVFALE